LHDRSIDVDPIRAAAEVHQGRWGGVGRLVELM